MLTDDIYTCGEHSTIHKDVESLCCAPVPNVTSHVNYTQIKNEWTYWSI